MRKIIFGILEAVMVLSLVACGKSSASSQMSNPFTDHSSMEEAEQAYVKQNFPRYFFGLYILFLIRRHASVCIIQCRENGI